MNETETNPTNNQPQKQPIRRNMGKQKKKTEKKKNYLIRKTKIEFFKLNQLLPMCMYYMCNWRSVHILIY